MDHPHEAPPMDDGSSKPTAQSPAGPGSVELPRGGLRNQAEALASGPTNGLRSQLLSLLLWLMVALLLRWLVVEPRWIPFKPGTVVVFHPPAQLVDAGYSPSSALIKRVVAGPGDRVEILAGRLLRNGARVEPDWNAEAMDYEFGPVVVPPGHLLVLGDNRNASLDSHVWGPLPRQEVIGTAFWRYWPLQRFGPIRSLSSEPPGGV
jgi:signal peptidase I